jgi:ribonuclease R
MLLANKYVAQDVSKLRSIKSLPFPYRVHDLPSEEKLLPFMAFAKKFGHRSIPVFTGKNCRIVQYHASDVQGKPEQHVLEQLGYPHHGQSHLYHRKYRALRIGFEHYCHFTSPIRRYPDVLVHRVLEGVLNDKAKAR